MARRVRGNSIQIRHYAGVDPTTGKQDYLERTVALSTGKRELDRIDRDLAAEAHRLANARRARRRDPVARVEVDPGGPRLPFRRAGEAWYRAHGRALDDSGKVTARNYLDLYLYPALGDVQLWRFRGYLEPEAGHSPELKCLTAFYDDLADHGGKRGQGLSVGTIRRAHGIARQVLGYAAGQGWLPSNPALEARLPKERRAKPVVPTARDAVAFFRRLAEEHPVVHTFAMVVTAGCRPNEVMALRWGGVDFAKGIAEVGMEGGVRVEEEGRVVLRVVSGDTHKRRRRLLRLDPVTLEALREHRAKSVGYALACGVELSDEAFVFSPDPDGTTTYNGSWATRAFGRAVGRARRDGWHLPDGVHLYSARHFAITAALAAGHPVADVAQRFGTSARTIYQTYAHAIPANDAAIAATMGDIWSTGSERTEEATPLRRRQAKTGRAT